MGDHQKQLQGMRDDILELPPGFRFIPRDDEIITFYLMPKVHHKNFTCITIGEVDINKTEPWDLLDKAKIKGEDLYFFHKKDRKYPSGSRANRATKAGYWKATGKDKEIHTATKSEELPQIVGMKKTLVFYMGRAPEGAKTDWVMHEFRLEGINRHPYPTSISSTSTTTMKSSASEDKWVVCRVFHKTNRIKREPALPPNNLDIVDGGIDQSSIPMPTPQQFPMLSDFMIDPVASYYSTTSARSSSVPCMVGMDSVGLHMNNTLFGSLVDVVPSMSFNHQMDMGAATTFIDGVTEEHWDEP